MLSKQQSPHFLPESENMTTEQIRKQSCFSFATPPLLAPSLNRFSIFLFLFCSFLLRFPGWGGEKRWGRREDSWWRKSGENSPGILCQTDFSFDAGFKDVKHWYSSLKLVCVCWKKKLISQCLSWENNNLQNYFLYKKELIIFHFNNRCFFNQINFSACVRTSNTAAEQQNKRSIGLQVLEKINLSHHLVVCPELFGFKYVLQ